MPAACGELLVAVDGHGKGRRLLRRGSADVGRHEARLDQAHEDVEPGELHPQRVGERLDGELGGPVHAHAREGDTADHGAQVDHAPGAPGPHRGKEGPRHAQQPEHVRLELVLDGLAGERLDRAAQGVAGIVDQHVEPVARGELIDRSDGGGHACIVDDVEGYRHDSRLGIRELFELSHPPRRGEHPVAASCELDRRRAPDARAGSGDEYLQLRLRHAWHTIHIV